ncbi:glucosyltransferase domain-containing protein [Streptococcus milleri]
MIFRRYLSGFIEYIKLNKVSALLICIIYLIVNTNIGLAEYPYIDDIGRQLQGYSGFSEHYSRYLSEYFARFINGGRHLTDTGLTTHIISALTLSLASLIVIFVLFPKKKLRFTTAFVSTILGINPWFLEPLSFRFDNPFMSFSILVSVIPFIFWGNKKLFTISSVVGVFLMCNSYQASSGVYIILTLTMLFLELMQGRNFKNELTKVFIATFSYVIGVGLYRLQILIKPPIFSDQAEVPGILTIFKIFITNAKGYLKNIFLQSSTIWIVLSVLSVILLIVSLVRFSRIRCFSTLTYTSIWLGLGSIFSYGIYLILPAPYYLLRPRYEYGLGIFLAIILVVCIEIFEKSKLILGLKSVISGLLVFYFLSFSFVYATSLKQQNEMFKSQSIILASSLNKYVTPDKNVIYVNRFLSNSPVFNNTVSSYPILSSLIMPNTNVSWDMTMRFNSITNLNIDFKLINTSIDFANEKYRLLEDTKMYNIYRQQSKLFVIMK